MFRTHAMIALLSTSLALPACTRAYSFRVEEAPEGVDRALRIEVNGLEEIDYDLHFDLVDRSSEELLASYVSTQENRDHLVQDLPVKPWLLRVRGEDFSQDIELGEHPKRGQQITVKVDAKIAPAHSDADQVIQATPDSEAGSVLMVVLAIAVVAAALLLVVFVMVAFAIVASAARSDRQSAREAPALA